MQRANLDLYTDYLLSTFGAATATGLSAMVEGEVSHDRVTRFLSGQDFTSKDLWQQVKPVVRSIEKNDGVLIFDDTIQEKAWTDENELMCWHYDHVSGRNVRGINLLNALYHSNGASIPVAFELVKKPIQYCDLATRQLKRRSEVTKNELMRAMIDTCIRNQLKFRADGQLVFGHRELRIHHRQRQAFHRRVERQSTDCRDRTGQEQQAFRARRGSEFARANRRARLAQGLCETSPCGAPSLYKLRTEARGNCIWLRAT